MGNKVSRVIIAGLMLTACDKVERITGPMWPPPKAEISNDGGFVEAEAIAGFAARFRSFAGFSILNTGTSKRWAYAYYTPIDAPSTVIAGKSLLVNPGANWSDTFNVGCAQLDLSTEGIGGRPDIGFAFYDKRGVIIRSGDLDKTARINECRNPYICIMDRNNPNRNCAECTMDFTRCLVPL